jgi:hypothetical protein
MSKTSGLARAGLGLRAALEMISSQAKGWVSVRRGLESFKSI